MVTTTQCLVYTLATLALVFVLVSRFLIPLIANRFLSRFNLKFASVSPASIRGIEWSIKLKDGSTVDGRIDRLSWAFTSWSGSESIVTISVLGIQVTVTPSKKPPVLSHAANPSISRRRLTIQTNLSAAMKSSSLLEHEVNNSSEDGPSWKTYFKNTASGFMKDVARWMISNLPWVVKWCSIHIEKGTKITLKREGVTAVLGEINLGLKVSAPHPVTAPPTSKFNPTSSPGFLSPGSPFAPSQNLGSPTSRYSPSTSPFFSGSSSTMSPFFLQPPGSPGSPTTSSFTGRKQSMMFTAPRKVFNTVKDSGENLIGRGKGRLAINISLDGLRVSSSSDEEQPVIKLVQNSANAKTVLEVTHKYGPKVQLLGRESVSVALEVGNIEVDGQRLEALVKGLKQKKQRKEMGAWREPDVARLHTEKSQIEGGQRDPFEPVSSVRLSLSLISLSYRSLDILTTISTFTFAIYRPTSAPPGIDPNRHTTYIGRDPRNEDDALLISSRLDSVDVSLQCTPDDNSQEFSEKNQVISSLAQVKALQIIGLSTWRPQRKILKVAKDHFRVGDPNRAVVVLEAELESVGGDMQLEQVLRLKAALDGLKRNTTEKVAVDETKTEGVKFEGFNSSWSMPSSSIRQPQDESEKEEEGLKIAGLPRFAILMKVGRMGFIVEEEKSKIRVECQRGVEMSSGGEWWYRNSFKVKGVLSSKSKESGKGASVPRYSHTEDKHHPLELRHESNLHIYPISVDFVPSSTLSDGFTKKKSKKKDINPAWSHFRFSEDFKFGGANEDAISILSLADFEIGAKGTFLGALGRERDVDFAVLDVKTSMMDVGVMLDSAEISLWRPAVVNGLTMLLHHLKEASAGSSPTTPSKAANVDSSPPVSPPASHSDGEDITADSANRHAVPTLPLTDQSPTASSDSKYLKKLPAGVTIYASFQNLSILLASLDLNPNCPAALHRGIWFKTHLAAEYCFLEPQHVRQLPSPPPNHRFNLQLGRDIVKDAASFHDTAGKSALTSLTAYDMVIRPVYNAAEFIPPTLVTGETAADIRKRVPMFPPTKPQFGRKDSAMGWDFVEAKKQQQREKLATLAEESEEAPPNPQDLPEESQPPEVVEAFHTGDPMLRIPEFVVKAHIREYDNDPPSPPKDSLPLQHIIDIGLDKIQIRFDVRSVYCVLNSLETLKKILPPKRKDRTPSTPAPPTPPISPISPQNPSTTPAQILRTQLNLHVVGLYLDLHFPLGERVFARARNLKALATKKGVMAANVDSLLAYVPAPRHPGKWDELYRFQQLNASIDTNSSIPTIALIFNAMRLRIPFTYVMAKLVQNIAATIKSVKCLVVMFKSGDFKSELPPKAEGPKKLPNIKIECSALTVELRDDPIETKLNLIWRVGLEENRWREEVNEAFDGKVKAIEAHEKGLPEKKNTKFTNKATRTTEEAEIAKQQYFCNSWVGRMKNARREQARREDTALRRVQVLTNNDPRLPIEIVQPENVAPLVRLTFEGVDLEIRKPDFGEGDDFEKGVKTFMAKAGNNGLPHDKEFSLFVPVDLHWQMDSGKIHLRDYPIPLVHIPAMEPGSDVKSWDFKTKLVIGEEMPPTEDSFFWLPAVVLPEGCGAEDAVSLEVKIAKTIMPVKTYACPTIQVRSPNVTGFCWGTSYQPAIQDMTRVLETFTHPPRDPSEKVGIWDKLRMMFHWEIDWRFKGPLHIHIKGSRSPYEILGHGAGFVLAYNGSPRLTINKENEQNQLIQIQSSKLFFAIPDMSSQLDSAAMGQRRDSDPEKLDHSPLAPDSSIRNFTKVCAKLTNGVRMGWGFVLERACEDDCEKCCRGPDGEHKVVSKFHRRCRFFNTVPGDFRPHYTIVFRTKDAVKRDPKIPNKSYDTFKGFRSDFIHFSMSLESPTSGGPKADEYSSFHFTPKAMTHFLHWFRLFGGHLSLPVRRGPLFPPPFPDENQKPATKFGKALATIKYRVDVAPLFISHLYGYDNNEDWIDARGNYLGIKCKIGRFQADIHQREQEKKIHNPVDAERMAHDGDFFCGREALEMNIKSEARPGRAPAFYRRTTKSSAHAVQTRKTIIVKHKPIYATDLILRDVDLRAVLATFDETMEDIRITVDDEDGPKPDYRIDPSNSEWYDFDDYVETDWRPTSSEPLIDVHQAAVCPRFVWVKRSGQKVNGSDMEVEETSKFGGEESHVCFLGKSKDAREIQIGLAEKRLHELQKKINDSDNGLVSKSLERKMHLVQSHINEYESQMAEDRRLAKASADCADTPCFQPGSRRIARIQDSGEHISKAMMDSFENVYQAHSPIIIWDNNVRDIVMKYHYSRKRRTGFEYHMSSVAIKFVEDMAKQVTAAKAQNQNDSDSDSESSASSSSSSASPPAHSGQAADSTLPSISKFKAAASVAGMMAKAKSSHSSHAGSTFDKNMKGLSPEDLDPWHGVPEDFELNHKYFIAFVKPQISLRSLANDYSVVLIAAMRITLQMFAVIDKEDRDDPVNSVVLHRNYLQMQKLQVFHPQKANAHRSTLTSVPLENLLDSRSELQDFDSILSQSDASIKYDKFNQLRLRNKSEHMQSDRSPADHTDHLKQKIDSIDLRLPSIGFVADAHHFAALYNIVWDLLIYSDPEQELKSKRLQNLLLALDHKGFDDIQKMVPVILDLQKKIRVVERKQTIYKAHHDEDSPRSVAQLRRMKSRMALLAGELDLIFDAIGARAEKLAGSEVSKKGAFRLEAYLQEITWRLLNQDKSSFVKANLKKTYFSWRSKKDSSNAYSLVIDDVNALDLRPDEKVIFREILTRGAYAERNGARMISIEASQLAKVGGIAVIETLDVRLQPIKVQIEQRVGEAIMKYFFPAREEKVRIGSSTVEDPRSRTRSSSSATTRLSTPNGSVSNSLSVPDNLSFNSGGGSASSSSQDLLATPHNGTGLVAQRRLGGRLSHKGSTSSLRNQASSSSSTGTHTPRLFRSGSSNSIPPTQDAKNAAHDLALALPVVVSEKVKAAGRDVKKQVEEMRERAASNRSFLNIQFHPTTVTLSFKGSATGLNLKKLMEVFDFDISTPRFQYINQTWSTDDLVHAVIKDFARGIRGDLLGVVGQYVKKHKPKGALADRINAITKASKKEKDDH